MAAAWLDSVWLSVVSLTLAVAALSYLLWYMFYVLRDPNRQSVSSSRLAPTYSAAQARSGDSPQWPTVLKTRANPTAPDFHGLAAATKMIPLRPSDFGMDVLFSGSKVHSYDVGDTYSYAFVTFQGISGFGSKYSNWGSHVFDPDAVSRATNPQLMLCATLLATTDYTTCRRLGYQEQEVTPAGLTDASFASIGSTYADLGYVYGHYTNSGTSSIAFNTTVLCTIESVWLDGTTLKIALNNASSAAISNTNNYINVWLVP